MHPRITVAVAVLAAALLFLVVVPAFAQHTVVQISVDRFQNSDSVHRTEVEPDTFAWGSTIVSAFHVARRPGSIGWGSADVGFSTSTDGGLTWTYGYLPYLTVNYKNGPYYGAADPAVAYDAKHGVWLISTLPLISPIGDVAVSRSLDGIHWSKPILIDGTHLDDKNWTVCDNTSTSPFYGNCYTEWDQAFGSGDVLMSVSSDGGKTWGPGKASADHAGGLGGEPLVQPNGTVVVPFQGFGVEAFRSTDGGKTWSNTVTIANIASHGQAGNFRNFDLPSAEIDGSGKIYVVWNDCRFRSGCSSDDIVMSTSTDGVTWTSPARIPIDPVTSTVDHFMPGIGVDPNTAGASAHLTVVLYYYPVSNCGSACKLSVGFTTSDDGGATWTKGQFLAGPMQLTWLPLSDAGYMVADYISVSYTNGKPFGVFAVAKPPKNGLLNEFMATTKEPLTVSPDEPRLSSAADKPVPGVKSDHALVRYYDDEGRRRIPESRLKQQASRP